MLACHIKKCFLSHIFLQLSLFVSQWLNHLTFQHILNYKLRMLNGYKLFLNTIYSLFIVILRQNRKRVKLGKPGYFSLVEKRGLFCQK